MLVAATTQPVLPNQQFWVLFIGAIVPLAGYVFNKYAPWNSETVKAIFQVVLTAVAGVGYTWLAGNVHGAGDFFQQAVTATISGLFAHQILWKPSGVNLIFGANRPTEEQKTPVAFGGKPGDAVVSAVVPGS